MLKKDISCFCIKNINIFRIFRKEYILYIKIYNFSYNIINCIALNLFYKLLNYKHINLYLSKRITLSFYLKINN